MASTLVWFLVEISSVQYPRYFVFHCNNQLLLHFSIIGAGKYWLRARMRASWGPERSSIVRWRVPWYGYLWRYHRCSTQGTAGKAVRYREGVARTSGETNFSGVHKDSLAACGPGARVLASPSNNAKIMSCKQDLPRVNSRASQAKKNYLWN